MTAPRRREQFILGRWLARRALCERFGGEAGGDWNLTGSAGRAPMVVDRPDIHLSLSHSGEWLACAVATVPVGVDIEVIKPSRDIHGLAEIVCNDDERRQIGALDGSAAQYLFHSFWTLKEAWLKQRGSSLDFTLMRRLRASAAAPDDADAHTWTLPEFSLVVALASDAARRSRFAAPHPLDEWHSVKWRLTLSQTGG